MSKPELLKVLPPFLEPPDEMEISSGGSTASSYRLDYQWTVGIGYRDMGGSAKDVTVISQPVLTQVALQINVAAPRISPAPGPPGTSTARKVSKCITKMATTTVC